MKTDFQSNLTLSIIMLLVGAMVASVFNKSANKEVIEKLNGNSNKLIRIETQLSAIVPDIHNLKIVEKQQVIKDGVLDRRITKVETKLETLYSLGIIK